MSTKRHFKKKTLLKKHKKVNLTKKHNKSRLTKRKINKLSGGAPYTDDDILDFENKLAGFLRKDDFIEAEKSLIYYLANNTNPVFIRLAKTYLVIVTKLKKQKIKEEEEQKIKEEEEQQKIKEEEEQQKIKEEEQEKKNKAEKKRLAMDHFNLSNEEEEIKTINHIWFKQWPDHWVPKMVDFNIFITDLFNDMKSGGNTVIHCSAGVGRTGVVYVVLKLLSEGYIFYTYNPFTNTTPPVINKDQLKIKIDTIINKERQNRNKYFVQADIQYNFIYQYFAGEEMFDYKKEFTKLFNEKCIEPNFNFMGIKNRYPDIYDIKTGVMHDGIIPCEASRVKLDDGTDNGIYINASNMSPLTINGNKIKIIAAQCPKDVTIKDFYQMLKDEKIKRIVMVTGLFENGREKCLDYFGSTLGDSNTIPNSNGTVVNLLTSNTIVDIRTLSYKEEVVPAGPAEAGPAAQNTESIPPMPLPEEAGPAAQKKVSRPPRPPMPLPEEAAEQLLIPEPAYKFTRKTTKAIKGKPKSKTNPLKKLEYPWDSFNYKAIDNYTPSPDHVDDDLTFKQGDVIYIKEIDDNWGLGSIFKNGPYDKYVPLSFFEENTHQRMPNINKNRLYDFLQRFINNENKILLSFCDCKLILLYILNYNKINLFGLYFTYEEKIELFKKIKQKHISSRNNKLSNFSLLKYTTHILNRIYGDHNIDISSDIITCSDIELDIYMIDKNYTYLFKKNEITQILSIFKKAGDLKNPEIDDQSLIFNKKPNSSNA